MGILKQAIKAIAAHIIHIVLMNEILFLNNFSNLKPIKEHSLRETVKNTFFKLNSLGNKIFDYLL
jgi:hypothetical protein